MRIFPMIKLIKINLNIQTLTQKMNNKILTFYNNNLHKIEYLNAENNQKDTKILIMTNNLGQWT